MLNPPYYLQLMIGPGVPVPVGRDVVDALTAVTVTNNTSEASVFQLSFAINARSPLNALFLIGSGAQLPIVRVCIVVISQGMPTVLMDGVVTQVQVQPGSNGQQTTLTVTGEDLSKLMGYIPLDGMPYPAQPPEARVLAMLAKYVFLGITPVVIPTVVADIPDPTREIPRQQGTDLAYIRFLANATGYEFYVDPGPLPLQSVAYWGPTVRIGVPQPALNTDMGPHTNVESMSFTYDAESATLPIVMIYSQELRYGIPIPIPNVNPLSPPLGAVPPIPKNVEIDRDSARRSPAAALLAALGRASRTADAAGVTGTLDVARYGRILKARKLVGVRGAGTAYDGLYFVKSVTHKLKRGEYKQDFSLVRNGLVSTVPRVPA
ncbi:MAG TPA: hypothetical protein VEK11_15800 [Thermoanaerobaculia bacterium]|nr:hypothetical protein [Thermoanaerobaculia bacterium]